MQLILSHHLSLLFCRSFSSASTCLNSPFIATCVSGCWLVVFTYVMTDFLLQFLYRHRIWFPSLCCLLCRQSLPSTLVREQTTVLFVSDLRHCFPRPVQDCRTMSIWFPLKTYSHLPLKVGFLSSLTLGCCSLLHNFVSNSEVSSSHHLINMKFYRRLHSWITRLFIVSDSFLVVQSQDSLKLNRILQFWLVIIELGPIERRSLGRRQTVSVYWTALSSCTAS